MIVGQKCDACGIISEMREYIYVRTTNGGLRLCRQCLDEINAKNPSLCIATNKIDQQDAALRDCLQWLPADRAGKVREVLGIKENA